MSDMSAVGRAAVNELRRWCPGFTQRVPKEALEAIGLAASREEYRRWLDGICAHCLGDGHVNVWDSEECLMRSKRCPKCRGSGVSRRKNK